MQGRPSTAWDDDDVDVPGDNLILDVEEAKVRQDTRTQNVVIGGAQRWAEDVGGGDGDALTLSPHLTPVREKAVVGFVRDFDKMQGRDDRGDEEDIIAKLGGDRKDLEAWIAGARSEAERNVAALIERGKVGHRMRPVTLVDMGKSKVERFVGGRKGGEEMSEIEPDWR